MNLNFLKGYREGLEAGDTLGTGMDEEELTLHLELSIDLGLIENTGYWSGRLASYGSDVVLSDGTMLSYE